MNNDVDLADFGFVRAAAAAPALALGDPITNAQRIADHLRQLAAQDVSIALFPELCLTGYTCEDLFFSSGLHRAVRRSLLTIAEAADELVAIVGAPWRAPDGRLFNAAVVLAGGRIRGVVPKQVQPNYGEFYECRWFASGTGVDQTVDDPEFGQFRIACNQLFRAGAIQFVSGPTHATLAARMGADAAYGALFGLIGLMVLIGCAIYLTARDSTG